MVRLIPIPVDLLLLQSLIQYIHLLLVVMLLDMLLLRSNPHNKVSQGLRWQFGLWLVMIIVVVPDWELRGGRTLNLQQLIMVAVRVPDWVLRGGRIPNLQQPKELQTLEAGLMV